MTQLARGQYRCDRCGKQGESKRLPFKWKRRGDDHICLTCWKNEPAEDAYVIKYAVSAQSIELPPGFWRQQRARHALWDGLVAIGEETLTVVHALRAQFAPDEAKVVTAAEEVARKAWEAFESAKKAKAPDEVREGCKVAAEAANVELARVRKILKAAAKKAGCDEKPFWVARDAAIDASPKWSYHEVQVEVDEARTRTVVERTEGGFQLFRSNADDVVESYRRAWKAWIEQPKRRRPRLHGQDLRHLRTVMRYSNGQSSAALYRGTPSLTLATLHADRCKKGLIARLRLAIGDGDIEGRVHLDHIEKRSIPSGDDVIRQVALIGDRLADRWVWSLHVTVRARSVPRDVSDERVDAIAIDLRWRQCPDNPREILVAQWLATSGLVDQVRLDLSFCDSRNRRSGLPGSWLDLDKQQRILSELVDIAKATVWQRLHGDCPFSEAWRLTGARRLLRAVHEEAYAGAADLLSVFEQEYRKHWRRYGRLQAQLIARRDQYYYDVAHKLCAMARAIVFEGELGAAQLMDLSRLALLKSFGAKQRHILAPSRFRIILCQVAEKYDTAIVLVEKHRTSTTCPICGGQAVNDSALLVRVCAKGHTWEQPLGACQELLLRFGE